MTRTTRILIGTAAAATAISMAGFGQPGAAVVDIPEVEIAEAPQPAITITGGTEDQHSMAEWAVARFGEADLPLPAIVIEFHEDADGCRGYLGHYSRSEKRLDVCNQGHPRTEPIHTILHELAHAWSFEYLPADMVEAFTEHRGVDAWHDDESPWWQQGREQAAEVVAWGLMNEDDPFINTWVIGEPCEQLSAAFTLLTGIEPLHLSTKSCR